jgi:murein DD-endopeptidase MepM/ murein hydrolase activator NlpD
VACFSAKFVAVLASAAVLCLGQTARADSASEVSANGLAISSPGLIPSLAGPAPRIALQDIVGTPVDFARMRKPVTGGVSASGLRGLPSFATMPSRLPLAASSLTSRFGVRRHPISGDLRLHSGVDLAAPPGTPVYAPTAGYVSAATWNGGYGLFVAIEHGGGMQTRYGHLSRLAVASGQYVAAGTVIGYVGSTGNSTGPHLHYEVRFNGQAVNPVGGR